MSASVNSSVSFRSTELCQPDRRETAVWICNDMIDDCKFMLMQQFSVLANIKAGMIECLSLKVADCIT